VSTKADVQRVLGIPNGRGESNWMRPPGTQASVDVKGPWEIWFYDDIASTDMRSDRDVITMQLRQQILLVFFKGDIFDGFFWTSNALKAIAR
jgi:hypothetical protein